MEINSLLELREIQTLVSELFTSPLGPRALVASSERAQKATQLICEDEKASRLDRVSVYADAYYLRLKEILSDDFELLRAVVGEAEFHEIVCGYLAKFPSESPNAAVFGSKLATFIRDDRLHTIAALEWAIVESIHEPYLSETALNDLPALQEQMGDVSFVVDPSVRFVHATFNVEDLWIDRRDLSDVAEISVSEPWLVVRRGARGQTEFHRMSHAEREVYLLMAQSKSVEEICNSVDQSPEYEAAVASMGAWIQCGLIKSLKVNTSPMLAEIT